MTPIIREARLSDLEALWALDQLCFEPRIAYSRQEMRRFFQLSTAVSAVAEIRGEIAGFAIGYLSRPGLAHILTMDVHPRFRRSGIGKALMRQVLRPLVRDGASETRLEVDAGNLGAIAFYEKLGFRARRRIENYYAPGRAALEMALPAGGTAEAADCGVGEGPRGFGGP